MFELSFGLNFAVRKKWLPIQEIELSKTWQVPDKMSQIRTLREMENVTFLACGFRFPPEIPCFNPAHL